jgi:predicted ATPase
MVFICKDNKLDKALAKAHGNPFYAIEIIYGLRDGGAVRVEDGKLVLRDDYRVGMDNIPETVEGMIGSRIDQLPAGPQLLLKVASVVGMEVKSSFSYHCLLFFFLTIHSSLRLFWLPFIQYPLSVTQSQRV